MKFDINVAIISMVVAVAASNYLVEIPINDWLTYGAFTYPLTFLVTEVTNYCYGPRWARRVVYVGFVVAVALSLLFMNPQIACASGLAFLVGQLLDISVFRRLRQQAWWMAPACASVLGSLVDTVIFFSIAFFGQGMLMLTLAAGDFVVKLLVDVLMLLPFRFFLWRRKSHISPLVMPL